MAKQRAQASGRSRQRTGIVLIALAAVVVSGVATALVRRANVPRADAPASLADVNGPEAGHPAPAFAISALTGARPVTRVEYAGHSRVVTFFAGWCESCWNDMAVLQSGYERYRDQGVVFVGIGVRDTVGSLRHMVERVHVTFPTGYDEDGDRAARPYRLYSIPTTVFVGADGIIKGVVQGRVHRDTLQTYLALIVPGAATPQ